MSVLAQSNELHYQGLPEVLAKALELNKIHLQKNSGSELVLCTIRNRIENSNSFLNLNLVSKKDADL